MKRVGNFFLYILSVFLFSPIASADDSLPSIDPRAVWKGDPFIDATVGWVKQEFPNIELKTGIEKFVLIETAADDFYDRSPRHKRRFPGKAYVPKYQTASLLLDLYSGHRLKVRSLNRNSSERLQRWLMQQPDRSVLPHRLLGEAIVQNGGNTLLALTDVWNLLSDSWAAAGTRNANPVTQKLYDVTGEFHLRDGPGHFVILPKTNLNAPIEDRIKFLVTKRGDVFSTYYHYFGAMLFSHYLAAKTGKEITGRMAATAAVKLEAKMHRQTSGLDQERQKRILNDIEGSNAGARLHTAAADPKKIRPPVMPVGGGKISYLSPDPKLSQGYLLENDGRAPVHFGSEVDEKFRQGTMTTEELKLRFEYAVKVNEEIFDPVILAMSSDGARLQVGLEKYQRSGAKDPELNALIQKFQSGWRGTRHMNSPDFSLDLSQNLTHLRGEMGSYDVTETRRRVDRMMNLVMETKQLKLIAPPPLKDVPNTFCGRLFDLIGN